MIPEVAQGSARLLEALEKLAEWAGRGPGGNSPSGPPSEDVVRAFEEALAGPSGGAAVEAGNVSVPPDAAGMAGMSSVPGPAASVPSLEGGGLRISGARVPASEMPGGVPSPAGAAAVDSGPDQRPGVVQVSEAAGHGGRTDAPDVQVVCAESSGEENPVRELGRLLDEFSRSGASIGPDALFRAQYLAGILKVQTQTGLKASQSVSQSMESVLRQQG